MVCRMPGFPVHHQLPELDQTHVHRVGDASVWYAALFYVHFKPGVYLSLYGSSINSRVNYLGRLFHMAGLQGLEVIPSVTVLGT